VPDGTATISIRSIRAGRSAFKTLPDGRRQILNFLLPGDLLGLQAAMFEAAAAWHRGIDGGRAVLVAAAPRSGSCFGRAPELAFDVAGWGPREESIVDENLLSTGRRSAAERIAALIVTLYKRADALAMVAGHTFAFPLSQQHIADALGLSLVHTNRHLARLRQMVMFTQANGSADADQPARPGTDRATTSTRSWRPRP